MYKRLPIGVALIFCIRATCLSRASNNGVHGSWQTRPWFNSTFEWNAKSGSSVAGQEVVALDSETYMAPGFLDSNALSPGNDDEPVQVPCSNRHTWNDSIVARYHNAYSIPIHIHQLQKSWMLFDKHIY